MSPHSKRPTLASIAAATGVSVQTVSNVVNNSPKVSDSTRERIQQEIHRVGYRPNRAARLLRTNSSMILGYRLQPTADGISGALFDRLLHGLTRSAHAQGYRILVFEANSHEEEIAMMDQLTSENNVDGFLLTSTTMGDRRTDHLTRRRIPFVAFGRPWSLDDAVATHDWVDVDGHAGTAAATRLLQQQGAQRIGYLGWSRAPGVAEDRRSGWRTTVDTAGPGPGEDGLLEAEVPADSAEDAMLAAASLFEAGADGLVCASDSLALGALVVARTAYPHLVDSIIGFDNSPVSAAVGLTSVDQPLEAAAQTMVDLLTARIEQRNQARRRGADASSDTAPVQRLLTPTVSLRLPVSAALGHTPDLDDTPEGGPS